MNVLEMMKIFGDMCMWDMWDMWGSFEDLLLNII